MTTTLRGRADLPAYLLIAFSGMWLPLLITGYHRDSNEPGMGALQQICVYAAMTSPALAAMFVLRYVARVPDLRAAPGLVLPRPWRNGLADCLLALFVPLALTVAALCVGAVFGVYDFDLRDLSGFRAEFAPDAGGNGISWLRLRSNSVLPAVLAHTVVSSATVRTAWLLSDSEVEMDPMSIGLQAWPGWIVMGLFVVWLVRTRRI